MAIIKYFTGKGFIDVEVSEEVAKVYEDISEDEKKVVDKIRKREEEFSLELALERQPDVFKTENLHEEFIKKELKEKLHEKVQIAISQLPPKHQEIIIKHFFNGIKLTELAKQYGIKKNTMREKIDRILKKLEKLL